MLSVNNISVSYGNVPVLSDVSLQVRKGEIHALIGSNGAGKTTTLSAISGLLNLNSGSIEFNGTRIDGLPPHRIVELGISMVPEGRGVFPGMSLLENLELGSYAAKPRKSRKESLEKVFGLFPALMERKNQLAGTLSGGEQQMLAIGRGLMSMPQLLMLDEPSLGLAPLVVKDMYKAIENINEEGISILLVEQSVTLALKYANRASVLENGKVVIQESASKLIDHPHLKKAYLGAL